MAYDEALTERMRHALKRRKHISEKRMMGGVCFLLNGNMLSGADRPKDGVSRFMFRVGKDQQAEALTRPGARAMEQGGRRMTGLVFVDEQDCNEPELRAWLALASKFVSTLPVK